MINKILAGTLLLILFNTSAYAWGDKGHKLIMKKAIEQLPAELGYLSNWKDYLCEQSLDADIRKKTDKAEDPKHYIDMDFYEEFLTGHSVLLKDSLIGKYGEEKVTDIGLLPWATLDCLSNLTLAFKERDRDKILMLIGDLGHYTADGHQPLHTVLNYNGQLTDQKGVHFRYEIYMIDKYFSELESSIVPAAYNLINDQEAFVFGYISDANFKCDMLLASDKIASARSVPESDDYYRILWFRTKSLTIEQISKASASLASLIYTAWNNAGRPSLNEMN